MAPAGEPVGGVATLARRLVARLRAAVARRGWPRLLLQASASLALGAIALFALLRDPKPSGPILVDPAVVVSPIRLTGATVLGAPRDWHIKRKGRPQLGEPVPVEVTAYCLRGLTRRDRRVRPGIVAADPRYFPLGRYVALYIGRTYLGKFLVDDTGARIIGNRLDIWTPECREARLFGRRRGTALLVRREEGDTVTPDVSRLPR